MNSENTITDSSLDADDVSAHPALTRVIGGIFKYRTVVLMVFALATLLLGYRMSMVSLDTELSKMVPLKHEYMINLFKHKDELSLGNDVRIVVESKDGNIFSAEYMDALRQISDAAFFLPGADKAKVQSLWTPNVRWLDVTVDGFKGGAVIPADYDGSERALDTLRGNILKSGKIGRLVADDFGSTMVYVPLIESASKEERVDYKQLSAQLEVLRTDYQSDQVNIYIIGFAKKIGDLIAGATQVVGYFLLALVLTWGLLYYAIRCKFSATLACFCSSIAVVWQLGLLNLLGFGIDPYSMLVPFLVFAIGISHAVQIINRCLLNMLDQSDRVVSARLCCASLAVPGLLALVSDAIGFATLYVIEIGVIRELAVAASIGVLTIVLTNLILLPLLVSLIRFDASAVTRARHRAESRNALWERLSRLTTPRGALSICAGAIIFLLAGLWLSQDLKVGDLDRGAPELRPDSRYNLDVAFITDHYSVSADVLVVMVETPPQACTSYPIMNTIDQFHWAMEGIAGVDSVVSLVTVSKVASIGFNEGNLKWATLPRDPIALNNSVSRLPGGLMNMDCSLIPVLLFLSDHKAETLARVTAVVEAFAQSHDSEHGRFVLASGNAGVEAATNETILQAQTIMLLLVYGVVSLLCLVAFRSIRVVIVIIAPLVLTSILCQALMAQLGIGVKVATLPVIALGVGIGVDYGIYMVSRLMLSLQKGVGLQQAYLDALKTTGSAVVLTGFALSIGVGAWVFSAIKFQADMGVLLTFMFLWNMLGAICLLPGLAYFILPRQLTNSHCRDNT